MLGLPVERVTLDCCDLYPSRSPRRSNIVSFSGPVSEARYLRLRARLWEGDWRGDLTNIMHSRDRVPHWEWAGQRWRAEFIVARYWDRIERLAGVLAERGGLSGAEVAALVRG
jgi:hypothetical protein